MNCIFVTDLHGKKHLYRKLYHEICSRKPDIVFIGGDLLPSVLLHNTPVQQDFINDFLKEGFLQIRNKLKENYPLIYLIMGNDDPRNRESALIEAGQEGLWHYADNVISSAGRFSIAGYNYVPPTPFQFKDWEKYDVSRYVDPGCVSPEQGYRTVPVSEYEKKWTTIKEDLDDLSRKTEAENAVFLFHSPPYGTSLDIADIAGTLIDHVPVDQHVGSIAIERFIREQQPLLTLHGHVHESTRLSGEWYTQIGRTFAINAAIDDDFLSLVSFDLENISGTLKRHLQ